jgi:hypothetical protein
MSLTELALRMRYSLCGKKVAEVVAVARPRLCAACPRIHTDENAARKRRSRGVAMVSAFEALSQRVEITVRSGDTGTRNP